MLEFICSVYNEEQELEDLIQHIGPYADRLNFIDDGSTDKTAAILEVYSEYPDEANLVVNYKTIEHTGLCEVGRIKALEMCQDDSWVLMCDADERFTDLRAIREWVRNSVDANTATHVYFNQFEYIDGKSTRQFQKVKLFKKSAAHLSPIIHSDPSFDGPGMGSDWVVIHRKTSDKQKMREREYLDTYNKLLQEGLIDEGKKNWFVGMHYYEKE